VIAGKDPMIGQALDLLVPDFAFDPDELLAPAYAGAVRARATRRRRQTVAVIAFAALLLFAGAAIAADRFDLLSFLHTSDRNSARFSIAPKRTYHGTAPLALTCPGAKTGTFTCHVSGVMAGGNRNYELGQSIEKVPSLTRQSMLDSLDKAQAEGADPGKIAQARADLAKVGDDFIRALATLTQIETVSAAGGSSGPAGTERVPPRGVPAWVACREVTLATARCRPLAALVGVATGTPLYFLQPSRDWRRVPTPPSKPSDFSRALEQLLGRKVTADETRFFVDFATVAATTGGSSGSTKGTPVAVSNARRTALLAPRSLGAPTRVVSADPRPLPHRLPDGLRPEGARLFRVVFDLLRSDAHNATGQHTIYVYLTRSNRLGVWQVAWVGTKP
jgi:hypothetical protein